MADNTNASKNINDLHLKSNASPKHAAESHFEHIQKLPHCLMLSGIHETSEWLLCHEEDIRNNTI